MVEDKEFNEVAQNSHWAGGLAWIWGSIVLFGDKYLFYFLAAGILITAWKEFWYDYKYENAEVRGSSLEDFCFYQVGFVVAVISYYIKIKLF